MTTVLRWSGTEIRALRAAKRMSIRGFAAHLGVSDRMISKWEAGADRIHPRPVNQAALDTSLALSSVDVQARFALLLAGSTTSTPAIDPGGDAGTTAGKQVRHPGDGKFMTLVDAGVFPCGPHDKPAWLPAFSIDVYPTTNADYARFVAAAGHRPPRHWTDGHCPDNLLDHPVVFVTWRDAHTYAE